MPACFSTSGSVLTGIMPHLAMCAKVVQTFCPLTTHSSPSRTALGERLARSDAEQVQFPVPGWSPCLLDGPLDHRLVSGADAQTPKPFRELDPGETQGVLPGPELSGLPIRIIRVEQLLEALGDQRLRPFGLDRVRHWHVPPDNQRWLGIYY